MNSTTEDRKLFGHETIHARFGDVIIREVKILDQFSHHYDKSIKFFNTPQSVCGYVVSAVAPIVAGSMAYISKMSEIEALLKKLNDPKFIIPEVENCMEIIQAQRTQYLKEYAHEFKSSKEKELYMRDWVATYEISDAMEILASSMENLLFLRFVSFQFPDLIKDLKHEEKRRLASEEQYREHRFIIESFAEGRKTLTIDEWVKEGSANVMNTYDKPLVFIGDLTGHFVVFLACKVLRENGVLENTVFMINSVVSDYMHYEEVIMKVCKLAFPESTEEKQE